MAMGLELLEVAGSFTLLLSKGTHLTTKSILIHMITHTIENALVVIPSHSDNVSLPHRLIQT